MAKTVARLENRGWGWCILIGALLLDACKSDAPGQLIKDHEIKSVEAVQGSVDPELLAETVRGTPYTAVLRHTAVVVLSEDENTDKHIHHAEVLETIRGPVLSRIEYVMYTEKGESSAVDRTATVIALCRGKQGYYWPGTGSSFPWTDASQVALRKLRKTLQKKQVKFSLCE